MQGTQRKPITAAHWGTYHVEIENGKVTGLTDFAADIDPSPIGHGIVDVLDDPNRIRTPMIRKSWLEGGPGARGDRRGKEPFVAVSWETASKLVAEELERVRTNFGNKAIYGGSYGWASAGRFHHAQSQLKRFLNCIGGFTRSQNSYSFVAAEVIVGRVLGGFREFMYTTTGWDSIRDNCELFVAFGGVPLKNGQIGQGGMGSHIQKHGLLEAHKAGVRFVNISPIKSDLLDEVTARWLTPRPSSDTALILALCYTLLTENLYDGSFLEHYTTGFDKFADYLSGKGDNTPKTAQWASEICGLAADEITALARDMAKSKTMISIAWSLTRQDHGEQPYWAAITLAAMLGGIGKPGTGIGFGYAAENFVGMSRRNMNMAAVPQGENPVEDFIPVARITDMLENPGGHCDYDGQKLTYPEIRLVWWAGGNPFHHHQDLNRFRKAWTRPDTIIVNEWCWNSLARHADIVLPCTTPLERSDISLNPHDPWQIVMDKVSEPVGEALDDHEIFRLVAKKMGVEEQFTEGRTPQEWQRWLWDVSRQQAAEQQVEMPTYEEFLEKGYFKVPDAEQPLVMLQSFREDPDANPLKTPSGKIEIFSEAIASFGYDDCPGHAVWIEPAEWLGNAQEDELHLISNQPRTKLHSQLDHGSLSRGDRIRDREPLTLNPQDAAKRGLVAGQMVRIYNERGSVIAGLRIDEDVSPGVVQMATGAWYDPDGKTCIHGNPNTLTLDKGTSKLSQGPIAHSCLVRVEAFEGELPPVTIYSPPEIIGSQ